MTPLPSPQPSGPQSPDESTLRRTLERGRAVSSVRPQLVRFGAWIGCLVLWSGTASAHGGGEHGGARLAFQVVLWVPVLTGLLGGVYALVYRRDSPEAPSCHRADSALALLLLVLGGTFALSASTTNPLLGIGGAGLGVLATGWMVNRGTVGTAGHGHYGRLALGGVCAHRVLEGVVIGAAYAVSSAIGAVGIVVVAGHTALETAAVGRSNSPRRVRAFIAICLVQVGYLVGALVGIGGGVSVPVPVHVATTGLLAGVFLVVGVAELSHTSTALEHGGVSE